MWTMKVIILLWFEESKTRYTGGQDTDLRMCNYFPNSNVLLGRQMYDFVTYDTLKSTNIQ